eukprot:scaffold14950_cov156-Cylindrotheca_fusiformis.AAC.1
MAPPIPSEKGSCLWKLSRTLILEENMCSVCKRMKNGMSRNSLVKYKIETKRICYKLYPEKEPEEEKAKRRICDTTEDQSPKQEGSSLCRPQRKRNKTRHFEPCPSGGSTQMNNNRSDGHKLKMRLRTARRMRAKHLIHDPARRRSVVAAIAGEPGYFSRGGTSRASKFKVARTMRQTLAGSFSILFQKEDVSTPERIDNTEKMIDASWQFHQQLLAMRDKENEKRKYIEGSSTNSTMGNIALDPRLPRTPPPRGPPLSQQMRNSGTTGATLGLGKKPAFSKKEMTNNGGTVKARTTTQNERTGQKLLPLSELPSCSASILAKKEQKAKTRFEKKVEEARKALGVLFDDIKGLGSHPERRPFLASLALNRKHARVHVAAALGIPIHKNEWTKISMHAKWPGPLKPIYRKKISRMRVPKVAMSALLSFLESPGRSQKYAFGTKLLAVCGGRDTVEIDNVSLRTRLDVAVAEYLCEVFQEIEPTLDSVQGAVLPEDGDRCLSKEKGRHPRQCRKKKDHDGKCAFTPKGSICRTTALELARLLTGPEIKKLAGLDDVKVLKGRDNFNKARKITDELFLDGEEAHTTLKQRIDDQELFFHTDYIPHLERISNNKCNCLTCGFCDRENVEDIVCPMKDDHGPSCTQCADGFAIFQEMKAKIQEKEDEAGASGVATNLQLQKLDQLRCDVETCISNLHDYCGHLARQTSEAEQAKLELENLDNDTAIVTSDYKMKILACFFRENQRKWFGKRGTTALGFMIVTNPADQALKTKGIKDVKFVMMVTDDSRQDDWAVACGKSYIYQNHLPAAIEKVIFVADGAGCFKSKLHRAIQGFWSKWTGVTEVKFRITPAGDGKTCLDGMFGRYNRILSTAVDNGASYWNAKTILTALEASNGLSSTTFVGYSPLRLQNPLSVELVRNAKYSSSILTTILASDCSMSTQMLSYAFKHTGYGSGKALGCSEFFNFIVKEKTENGKETKTDLSFYDKEVGLVDVQETMFAKSLFLTLILARLLCLQTQNLDNDLIEYYMPSWKDFCAATNAKQDTQSWISKPGEGRNSKEVRGKNRQNRVQRVSDQLRKDEEVARCEMKEKGLFPCDKKCDKTGSYCEVVCNSEIGLGTHQRLGAHKFPSENSKDWICRQSGEPGSSSLTTGSRPNRQSTSLFKDIVAANPGTPAEIAAHCFQQFNRSDTIHSQSKTDGQICFLLQCFGRADKLNPMQTVALMRSQTDEIDGGLKFCNKKAHIQMNGNVLTEEQVGSWQSQEVSKRDSNKDVSGVSRLTALRRNLGVLKDFIASNRNGATSMNLKEVNAILFSLDISGTGKTILQKQRIIEELNLLERNRFDEILRDVSSRIDLYVISIEASMGRFQRDAEVRNRLLEAESNLIMNLEST